MRRAPFVVGFVVLVFGCGGGGSNPVSPGSGTGGGTGGGGGGGGGTLVHAVRVSTQAGLSFTPSAVTIAPNDTVYYEFGTTQHNVTFDSPGSPADVGNSSSTTEKRVFPTTGTYSYHCSIHPSMTGAVTVNP